MYGVVSSGFKRGVSNCVRMFSLCQKQQHTTEVMINMNGNMSLLSAVYNLSWLNNKCVLKMENMHHFIFHAAFPIQFFQLLRLNVNECETIQ